MANQPYQSASILKRILPSYQVFQFTYLVFNARVHHDDFALLRNVRFDGNRANAQCLFPVPRAMTDQRLQRDIPD